MVAPLVRAGHSSHFMFSKLRVWSACCLRQDTLLPESCALACLPLIQAQVYYSSEKHSTWALLPCLRLLSKWFLRGFPPTLYGPYEQEPVYCPVSVLQSLSLNV